MLKERCCKTYNLCKTIFTFTLCFSTLLLILLFQLSLFHHLVVRGSSVGGLPSRSFETKQGNVCRYSTVLFGPHHMSTGVRLAGCSCSRMCARLWDQFVCSMSKWSFVDVDSIFESFRVCIED